MFSLRLKLLFSPQYGFSVNVKDIDSSYTLGDIARRYQQILEKLTTEGLVNKNKGLPIPFDIQNVLVIAPENAAGLGDVRKDADVLDHAGVYHFVYHSATFQGNRAPTSIIESLSAGLRQWANDFDSPPDLIVINSGKIFRHAFDTRNLTQTLTKQGFKEQVKLGPIFTTEKGNKFWGKYFDYPLVD